ncbi:MAG: hybrid sensor histidine kinase/response regulator [Elusimicrobia bacterium]|nr:hybrid sensor histidine kinase/response regulator [Elusimicrobiota bacterium]
MDLDIRKESRLILVVDDEEEQLFYVRETLELAGHRVLSASSAAEAGSIIETQKLALILADLRLGGHSGLELLALARQKDPVTVGILLTGHGSLESALEAMREGVFDYLVKPCSPEALVPAVQRGLEHHKLRLELLHKTSELEKLELRLRDKAQMIHNVSHELKNPLAVVCGYSAFLLDRPDPAPEELRKSLQSIHNNAQRLSGLLEELLESARLANHKVKLDLSDIPVESLAREMIEDSRFQAEQRQLDLAFYSGAGAARVRADKGRAQQILGNLLGNAIKFTPAGGAVKLLVEPDGGMIRFCVRDTGIGIAESDLPHLFERFYQAGNAQKDYPGLGLGLEIAKGLVELHGGRIWAESRPGHGSSFYFTLPSSPA